MSAKNCAAKNTLNLLDSTHRNKHTGWIHGPKDGQIMIPQIVWSALFGALAGGAGMFFASKFLGERILEAQKMREAPFSCSLPPMPPIPINGPRIGRVSPG